MHRSKEEKMIEEALGDAALDLLKKEKSISRQSIEKTLRRMLDAETNVDKKQACQDAIREIQLSYETQQPDFRIQAQPATHMDHMSFRDVRASDGKDKH